MSAPVKSRELVPVLKRNVHGEPEHLENLIAGHRARGTLVNHSRPVWDPYIGSYCLTLVYRQPRPRLLVRARRRVLMVVWPPAEGKLVRALRVLGYIAGAVVTAFATYLLVQVIEAFIAAVEFVVRYWQAFAVMFFLAMCALVVVSVRAGAGAASGAGDFVIRVCRTCLRPFH